MIPLVFLSLSVRAFAVTFNVQAIHQYCETPIGTPSTYYCTIAYKTPRYPNGFCSMSFKFTGSFTINPATFTYTGTLDTCCWCEWRDQNTLMGRSFGYSTIEYWNSSNCNPSDYEIIGISNGTDTNAFHDNFDFKKNDNEMKMCLWLDAEFNESRTFDWWCSTDLYKVTFTVTFNGVDYDIPIQFYPQFLIDIGTPTAQYGTTANNDFKYPPWMEDYFLGSDPDISYFGKIFQDYPVKGYKTYSADFYRNTTFLYNRSDGTKMYLTAWCSGNLETAPEPNGTPLNLDTNNPTHYYYNNEFNMLPYMATSEKFSNGSGVSEFLEFYLSDIKNEMVSRLPSFTTNDLYKCTYTVKCYGKNKPSVIAYSKTLDWSEYLDSHIAPPIMEDSAFKRNYFDSPLNQNLSDNGTDTTIAPPPFARSVTDNIDSIQISDYTFENFNPNTTDVSMFTGFFSLFLNSPFGAVILIALTFLVIKTLIW